MHRTRYGLLVAHYDVCHCELNHTIWWWFLLAVWYCCCVLDCCYCVGYKLHCVSVWAIVAVVAREKEKFIHFHWFIHDIFCRTTVLECRWNTEQRLSGRNSTIFLLLWWIRLFSWNSVWINLSFNLHLLHSHSCSLSVSLDIQYIYKYFTRFEFFQQIWWQDIVDGDSKSYKARAHSHCLPQGSRRAEKRKKQNNEKERKNVSWEREAIDLCHRITC